MHTSELVYIIPPYLLNTALGAKLQKKLAKLDPKLSQLNYLSTNSKFYNDNSKSKSDGKAPKYEVTSEKRKQFSDDPILNQIIKDKLIYKLSIVGLAGDSSPMERLKQDEDYLFEIFDTFKSKISYDRNPRHKVGIKRFGDVRGGRTRRSNTGAMSTGDGAGSISHGVAEPDSEYDSYDTLIFAENGDDLNYVDIETLHRIHGIGDGDDDGDDEDDDIFEGDDDDFNLALDEDDDNFDNGAVFRNYDDGQHIDGGNDSIDQDTIDQQDFEGRSSSKNVYNSEKVGEFKLEDTSKYINQVLKENAQLFPSQFKTCKYTVKQYQKFMGSSLKSLLLRVDTEEKMKSNSVPSFVEVNEEFFQYPLPVSWVPLTSSKYSNYLQNNLGLDIKIDNGFSNIELCQKKVLDESSEEKSRSNYSDSYPYKFKDKYTNFIGDKTVPASCGVFYYEVEIKQKCTAVSDFRPIIVTNEEAVSSNNSISVCLGFTQRFTNVDFSKNPAVAAAASSNNNGLDSKREIDLEVVKNDVDAFIYSNSPKARLDDGREEELDDNSMLAEDHENFLSVQPGLFRGSYAVNFEDSLFYNSEKASESLQRTAVLNMNRRLSLNRQIVDDHDSGKLELGFTLSTYLERNRGKEEAPSGNSAIENHSSDVCDVYNTEIIGCGINFYDKSIFYTSNGILVKVITNEELKTTNSNSDASLFFDSESEASRWPLTEDLSISELKSVYPMIGMKLNTELKSHKGATSSTNVSHTSIKTNLGFKEFKYNINNHIRTFRSDSQNSLYQRLLQRIQSHASPEKRTDEIGSSVKESEILNINGKSTLINKLIKGYLNYEGYLESFKSFDDDLQNLTREIGTETAEESESSSKRENVSLENSQAANRQLIMNHIRNSEFDHALNILSVKYPTLLSDTGNEVTKGTTNRELKKQIHMNASIIFELKLFKYISMIKAHLEEYKNGYPLGETRSIVRSEIFANIFNYGKELSLEYPRHVSKIQMFSSLLLIKDGQSLANLPRASDFLQNYDEKLNWLASTVNKMILYRLGYKANSNLERIVGQVNDNVSSLGINYCDPAFMLVNFERDYMDL
ncbi:hypothetical protein CLIB1423_13S02036 [[Candida] railenensis]|uniref:CTLH/CRA C-terminal to LisH motif domain-containing protein n=1 Tax=[Candida] railenensis TaxID=45579 RepID=A0A9P0QR08_9ASCO|nr:hypothetical protein CLIB1423_13S02036 [[Candida] railenensis]